MGLAHTITVLHYGEVLAEGTPGRDPGQPARAGGLSQDLMLTLRRTSTPTTASPTSCTACRIEVGAGRGRRPARAQRRGQEHDAQDDHGPGRAPPRARSRSRAARSPGWPPHRLAARSASRGCPRSAGSSGSSPCSRTCAPGLDRPGVDRGAPAGAAREGLRALPRPARAPRSGRRHAVGRRAADARHRARDDARAEDHPARRADRGADAAHGRADPRDHPRAPREGVAILLVEQNVP